MGVSYKGGCFFIGGLRPIRYCGTYEFKDFQYERRHCETGMLPPPHNLCFILFKRFSFGNSDIRKSLYISELSYMYIILRCAKFSSTVFYIVLEDHESYMLSHTEQRKFFQCNLLLTVLIYLYIY